MNEEAEMNEEIKNECVGHKQNLKFLKSYAAFSFLGHVCRRFFLHPFPNNIF